MVTSDVSYEIAPGLTIREWDQTDYRGPIRANLLTVDLNAANISLDYLGAPYAVRRQTVSQLGAADGAIAAINGDFFDISDTGAALGVAIDSQRGLLQGSRPAGSRRTRRSTSTPPDAADRHRWSPRPS